MNRLLILTALLLCSVDGTAHGTADNHLQIMVIDDRVKMNITVDMRVLNIVDSDKDGYASLAELRDQRERLKDWVTKMLDVSDEDGDRGTIVFADLTSDLNIAKTNRDRVDHARIMRTLEFAKAPERLRVNLGGLATLVPELKVTVIDASSGLKYRLRDPSQPQSLALPGAGIS